MEDYQKAVELNLTKIDRCSTGQDHHPMSERIMRFLAEHAYKDHNDYFCWKLGGDGDNGEELMFELDTFFELLNKIEHKL